MAEQDPQLAAMSSASDAVNDSEADAIAQPAALATDASEQPYQVAADPAVLAQAIPFNADSASSIEAAKAKLVAAIGNDIAWYEANKKKRSRWAQLIRGSMIAFGGVSALLPIVTPMAVPAVSFLGLSVASFTVPASATSAMMVVTATLYAYERYYGNADAWMRFEMAKQRLQRLQDEFELNWLALLVAGAGKPDLAKELTELIRVSGARYNIIQTETEQWISSFKAGMKTSVPKAAEEGKAG